VKPVEVEFSHGGVVEGEILEEMVVIDELNDKVMLRVLDVAGTDVVEFDNVVAKVVVDVVDVLVGVLQEQDPVRSTVTTVTVRVTVCR
jgi:hypothetical protein